MLIRQVVPAIVAAIGWLVQRRPAWSIPPRGPPPAAGRYRGYSSGMSRNSLAIIPMVMSPGWRASVGTAAGLILINGGSSGSAHMTCCLLPNHRLILILNM
jgi:hypothetical protein